MNVNRIVINREVNVTVTSGLFPRVAIKTMKIEATVNMREIMIPACVDVVPNAEAILVR